MRMSTFSGIISEFPGISVDNFAGRNLASTLFFLSHCHRDHMNGLDSVQLANHLSASQSRKLYCSAGSASILRNHGRFKLPDRTLAKIVELEMDSETFITLKSERYTREAEVVLSVTMVPANHCPGSVMYIFKRDQKCVLYTGDFRFYRDQLPRLNFLRELAGSLSTVYLDTTFAHKNEGNSFVTRENAIRKVCDSVERWQLRYPEGRVGFITKAEFGYEAVFEELFKHFQKPVHVCDYKFDLYDGMPEVQRCLTRRPSITNLHACFTRNQDFCFGAVAGKKTLLIKLCAMTFSLKDYMGMDSVRISPTIEKVAYSMHCSMEELTAFVEMLQPEKIVPCVVPRGSSAESVLKLFGKDKVSLAETDSVHVIPPENLYSPTIFMVDEDDDGFVPPVRPSQRKKN